MHTHVHQYQCTHEHTYKHIHTPLKKYGATFTHYQSVVCMSFAHIQAYIYIYIHTCIGLDNLVRSHPCQEPFLSRLGIARAQGLFLFFPRKLRARCATLRLLRRKCFQLSLRQVSGMAHPDPLMLLQGSGLLDWLGPG